MPSGEISSEPPRLASGERQRRYYGLMFVGNGDPTVTDLELGADKVDIDHQNIQDLELGTYKVGPTYQKNPDKIRTALKLLRFQEEHVLVQFWSPHEYGKQRFLSTMDQPYGFGEIDEGLSSYRKDSEGRSYTVDKDHEEGEHSPATRVFGRGLPEWTLDLDNYTPKHFPQQEFAINCNLHGYLALPVFDSETALCVGVLEVLTSSKYMSYAYEVQEVHNALKTVDLRSPQPFDCPKLNVRNNIRQDDCDKIYGILREVCDIHSLPLAQTWRVSPQSSFVSHEKVIEKSCSSFDTRCVGKVCMSRAALPFHVQDLGTWPFLKACQERHLDVSRGFVGKALLSHGSCFCGDVTKLSEDEYPLVHHARMNGLSSCFAIFLHTVEANDDYVLEFFLPPGIKDAGHLLNLVQTLKQNIEIASGFELGDSSCIQVVGPPTEVGKSLSIDPHTIHVSSVTTTNNNKFETLTSDSQSIMVNIANKTESSEDVSNQVIRHYCNIVGASRNNQRMSYPNVNIQKMNDNVTDAGEKSNRSKQGRKIKRDSLTMEAVVKHVGKPGVSDKAVSNTKSMLSRNSWPKQNLQRPSNTRLGLSFVVFLIVRVKRWSCSIKRHGFSGKWWSCGRHSYLPSKSDFIYQAARLFSLLRRWKNKSSMKNAVSESTINNIIQYSGVAESTLVQTTLANISDIKMVTVKATYKEDMIKFQFPTSLGLLELEHQVARRIKLKSRRLKLKYKDEEDDLILLACDADLYSLLRYAANHSIIRLVIWTDDYS